MKKWQIVGTTASAVLLIGVIYSKGVSSQYHAQFEEQLRLARQEGIPTTPEEFEALVPECPEDQNAAPIYAEMVNRHVYTFTGHDSIKWDLLFSPNKQALSRAKEILDRNAKMYALLDEASDRPFCKFRPDWSQGEYAGFPGPAAMGNGVGAIAFRAAYRARKGDVAGVLSDLRRIIRISNHSAERPSRYQLGAQRIYFKAIDLAAQLSFSFRSEPRYRIQLKSLAENFPELDLVRSHTGELFLDLLHASAPQETLFGRKDNFWDSAWSSCHSPDLGRAKIVESTRVLMRALKSGGAERSEMLQRASQLRNEGWMEFFPGGLNCDLETDIQLDLEDYAVKKRLYSFLSRLLAGPEIFKGAVADDSSRRSANELTYSFDGKTLVIGLVNSPQIKIPDERPKEADIERPG